ncbi:IMPACT family protein [Halorussus gelatinilyticus]|uniref:IMPACT family protein n=1 Tax=Halorussus gelatinilyticus TaxID=2937524 RepID=A0A8U0ILH6_9EURY|nr:YigZ family protein [Halorussus gelatinilyticus]UPW01980.1 IMPACT family protein [Halorussus gelatinilyticus]
MTDDTYLTLAGRGRATFEIRGSEFVGHAAPAADREAAEAFVAEVRAEYDDATHNVPAYRVRESGGRASGNDAGAGRGMLREYGDDDGEPSGSAGKPALNVLQQEDVENAVAVVTRYYGGTNLGVGGLARAYSRGVKEAIEDAGIVAERPHERFSVAVEYDDSGTVRGILESASGDEGAAFDADYAERVSFEVRVPVAEAEGLRDRIRSATSGRAEIDGGE